MIRPPYPSPVARLRRRHPPATPPPLLPSRVFPSLRWKGDSCHLTFKCPRPAKLTTASKGWLIPHLLGFRVFSCFTRCYGLFSHLEKFWCLNSDLMSFLPVEFVSRSSLLGLLLLMSSYEWGMHVDLYLVVFLCIDVSYLCTRCWIFDGSGFFNDPFYLSWCIKG